MSWADLDVTFRDGVAIQIKGGQALDGLASFWTAAYTYVTGGCCF